MTIAEKILHRINRPDLLQTLSEELTPSELNSLLLEVFDRRIQRLSPANLLQHYQKNRFVKPADLDVMRLRELETRILQIFETFQFRPVELSPVAPLGSCSVVATADQKKVLSALRGTEVLADATNALALHAADLKKSGQWQPTQPTDQLRLSTIQRHVRTPPVTVAGHTQHFKIGCLVSSGRDTGNFQFECESLAEHLAVMTAVLRDTLQISSLRFRFIQRAGVDQGRLLDRVATHIRQLRKDLSIETDTAPGRQNPYYKGLQYKILITVGGQEYEIGDGGFVDWTQQLLQNKKERFLITGLGVEQLFRLVT
ncbi:hypothetical protein LX87_02387 [Larkinella arboricola]|uniref:Uncharacterized protein n=1 Tax=Larkinella arboricola TaxID=643671 RepID=A0A327WYL7_LARAB|nr:hypothetical protein [Larkinella arboricola]RAJ97485.1 hypothetical protein LX87_02387 [Larkinella arboricola]